MIVCYEQSLHLICDTIEDRGSDWAGMQGQGAEATAVCTTSVRTSF
jgi:hypothetical protein